MNTKSGTGPAPERVQPDPPADPPTPERAADSFWLGTPSGIVALVALVLSVFLPPLFFPLAGLAFVLAVVALVRRRPRPRSALVVTIISGVLLLVVLAIGILVSGMILQMEDAGGSGEPGAPAVPASAPAEQP